VPIKITTDPEIIFIPAPEFVKPFYSGQLHANGTLEIEEIALDLSTYDEHVNFTVIDDEHGLISLSANGPVVSIVINIENLTEAVLSEKFIMFAIQAKREGDRDGYAVIILDLPSSTTSSPQFSFSKTLYEGEFDEKTGLAFEDVTLNGASMEGITFAYSMADEEFFNFNENSNTITITVKDDASIDSIMAKTSLIFIIDAHKDGSKVASTIVVIKTITAVVPRFDKSFYTGVVRNGFMSHEAILITDETFSEDVEVTSENANFDVSVVDKEVKLSLKSGVVIPSDETLLTFYIDVKKKDGGRKSEALVVIEIDNDESLAGSLLFESAVYEGKIKTDSTLDIPEIKINAYDAVNIELSGAHENFFSAFLNENVLRISLKDGFTVEQFTNDLYLQITVTATHENMRSGSTSIILGIEKEDDVDYEGILVFNSALYQGSLKADLNVSLPSITINPYEDVLIELTGTHGNFFNANRNDNAIEIKIKDEFTFEQLSEEPYLQITATATHDNLKTAVSNIILEIEKEDDDVEYQGSLIFNAALYQGSITQDLIPNLPAITINEDENVAILLSGTHGNFFTYTLNQNQLSLNLVDGISFDQFTNDIFLQVTITASREGFKSTTANVVIGVVKESTETEGSLTFGSALYEGKLAQDLNLTLPIITINPYEDVNIELSGTHGNFFTYTPNQNQLTISLKDGSSFDQFTNENYLQITVTATHDSLKTAVSNIIIALEREDVEYEGILVFNSALYQGSLKADLNISLPAITVNPYEDVIVQLSGTHGNFFNANRNENAVEIKIKDEFTFEQLSEEPYLQITMTATHDNMKTAVSNIILEIENEDDDVEYQGTLIFNSAFYQGSITHDLNLTLPSITINEDENVAIILSGTHGNFFAYTLNQNQLTLKLLDSVNFNQIINDIFLQVTITASRDGFKSATANVVIGVVKESTETEGSLTFGYTLYEGTLSSDLTLNVPSITINPHEDVNIELSGEHASFFTYSKSDALVTIELKSGTTLEQFNGDIYAPIIVTASHASLLPATTIVIIKIESKPEETEQKLEFSSQFYEAKITQDLRLSLPQITIDPFEGVAVSLAGTHASFFTIYLVEHQNQVTIELNAETTFEQFADDLYLHISIHATHDTFTSASADVIIGIERQAPVEDTSAFEKSLYAGSISNQKILSVEPIFINSESTYSSVAIAGADSEYFTPTLDQNFVTLTLAKEITEDLMFEKSVLTAQITAVHGDSSIHTNIIVTLPRITQDNILRFESSFYIGSWDKTTAAALEIDDIVLALANYDDQVAFSLSGSDMALFTLNRDANTVRLELVEQISEEDVKDRVFLSLKVEAKKEGLVTAETAIFIHLNVIVSEIEPIAFENPVYVGTLSYDRVLSIESVKLLAEDSALTSVIHSGEHSDKFEIVQTAAVEKLTEIEISFIQQPVDVNEKFYHFYIEAFKMGAPKAYATVVIEIIDRIQLAFDELKYFGTLDGNQVLVLDSIQLNSQLAGDGVTFSILDGQSQYFRVASDSNSSVQITKAMTIPDELLLSFRYLWFYLQAAGNSFHSSKTLVIIETTQSLAENPIEECYDALDPTQPFFETGSYSFTITNQHTGYLANVRAVTTDSTVALTYALLFENSFLYDKLVILNGDLMLNQAIPTGIYRVTAIAKNLADGKEAAASVTLRVQEATVCEDGDELVTTVEKSLAIVKIEENTIESQIMYARVGNCEYEILQVHPNELRGEFCMQR
jgi:hypothetical protein